MLSFEKIYLVRHGSYDRSPKEQLTAEGEFQSREAGQRLLDAGVRPESRLVSSDAPRALQTSGIISSVIETEVIPSKRVNIIGNYPEGVASLDQMLEAALADAEVEPAGKDLVVVTHQPLLDIVYGDWVTNGQVIEYQSQNWNNPVFDKGSEQFLMQQLGSAGLQ